MMDKPFTETIDLPRVLIVDDISSIRQLIRLWLRNEYQIQEAENGQVALEIIRSDQPPELILLDLHLPGMSGRDILQAVRHDPVTKDIAVIIMTADDAERAAECLEGGADDYQTKPLDMNGLISRMRHQISRRRLERRLKSSEEWLHLLFESAPEAMIVVGLDGRIIRANSRAGQMFGFAENALLGLLVEVLLPESFRSAHVVLRENYARSPTPVHRLARVSMIGVRQDGSDFPVRISLNPIDHEGCMQIIVGLEDISEKIAFESRIQDDRAQQHLLRELLEYGQSKDTLAAILERCLARLFEMSWLSVLPKGGIFLASPEHGALRLFVHQGLCNEIKTMCARVPYGRCMCGQAAASKKLQFVGCVDEQHVNHYEGMPDHGHYSLPLLDGENLLGVLVLYLPPHFTRDPQREEFLESIANILAGIIYRKQYEAALEDKVAERTEALQVALDQAERMARVKTDFLANMSHEIRTPLNGILGVAQIGRRDTSGRQSQRLFNQVLDSGNLLLGIVNDILDFSKVEAGKLRVEEVDVDLNRLIQHVTLMCGDRASEKGFLFRIEHDETLPQRFRGDPLRIAQCLCNLVGNAIKFTEQGEVVLSLARNGETLVIRVQDTGIGMSEEQLGRLFSAFEQADNSITRRFGGTGLGLTITQRLVDLMGGRIEVSSRLGEGSVFEIHLPLVACTGPAPSEPVPAETMVIAEDQPLAGLRVLVAEDNAVNRMVMEDMLSIEGAVPSFAENGQEALDMAEQAGFDNWDIVLTDINMPVMDGHTFARHLRERAPSLPVIGVTAHAMDEERRQCAASGMVAHVAKPIVLETLIEVILRHARRGLATATQQPVAAKPAPEADAPASVKAWGVDGALGGLINWPKLIEKYSGRETFIEKLLDTLLKSHAETPNKLRAACAQGDHEAVRFAAHSLAGVMGALYAEALQAQARAAEGLVQQGAAEMFEAGMALADTAEKLLDTVRIALAERQAAETS